MERIIYSSPILDLDKNQTAEAARLSVFMNVEAMEQLIEIVMKQESSVSDSKAKKALSLLQTFVVRGLFNMTHTLKGEYTRFLQKNGLMANFLKLILSEADQQSIHPDELLVSSLLLELRADYLREAVMLSDKLTFEDAASGNKVFVFTSKDASQMYVMRSEAPTDIFHFNFETQFGESEGQYFEGSLVASDPVNNENSIFVIESEKLAKPDNQTLLILKYARIVITDNAVAFDNLMKQLKVEIQKDEDNWRECANTRFMVLSNPEDVEKLLKIAETGSTIKNEDTTDRAYFLGQLLKHLDSSIWEKVSKEKLRRKFADYSIERSTKELMYIRAPATLGGLIESNYSD